MDIVGKIYLDSEGYVCIRWEDEVGKLVSEHGLQERAGEIWGIQISWWKVSNLDIIYTT